MISAVSSGVAYLAKSILLKFSCNFFGSIVGRKVVGSTSGGLLGSTTSSSHNLGKSNIGSSPAPSFFLFGSALGSAIFFGSFNVAFGSAIIFPGSLIDLACGVGLAKGF